MKYSIYFLLALFIFSCTSDDNNLLEDITFKGGFIAFETAPEPFKYNLLDLDGVSFSERVVDPNNNATQYSLQLSYNDIIVNDFVVLNSFPADINFTMQEVFNALGVTVADLDQSSIFQFIATVTTPTGEFVGTGPDFDDDTNTNEGGNSAGSVFGSGMKQAMNFKFNFFVPPPKKLRGTSFEEPFASDDPGDDYIRTDGEDDTAELFNHDGERHVMHVATGTGVDDEIGFRAFFISNGGGGFENEEIGVTKKTEDVDAFVDGVQGYQLEDVDGKYRLMFDKVAIPAGQPKTGVQIQIFFRSTSWEDDDTFYAYVEVEKNGSTETMDLLNISGDEIDDREDSWLLIDTGFLDGVSSYQLIIDSEIDSSSEEIYFDQMLVYVPEG